MAAGPQICELGQRGLLLPLAGDWEQELPQGLRAVLYLLGLGWCFMGVAIIADIFMNAIEKVTSQTVRYYDKRSQRFCTFEVWNATVANLTLMALGSSAPEIMLNVIDIFAKDFYLEGLGPGTIVGSAAFNLLIIIAVCIMAIPDGQLRSIKDLPVYLCTASWSVFAYCWLLIIIVLVSPNVVEVWEGVLTFLFFPLLVLTAFACDKGWLSRPAAGSPQVRVRRGMTAEELARAEAQVQSEHGKDLTTEQIVRILGSMNPLRLARSRHQVVASLTGGRRAKSCESLAAPGFSLRHLSLPKHLRVMSVRIPEPPSCCFEFASERYAVKEDAGHVEIKVRRKGDLSKACRVWYESLDGTAQAPSDYIPVSGWLEFQAGQAVRDIQVEVVDDAVLELDEEFYMTLAKPQVVHDGGAKEDERRAVLGKVAKCTVVIIDDDEPGTLVFDRPTVRALQRAEDFEVPVVVHRRGGSCGRVTVRYSLEAGTALPGRDFVAGSGVVDFEHQQIEAQLSVTIKGAPRYDGAGTLKVVLSEPTGGAKLDSIGGIGGVPLALCMITVEADPEARQRLDHMQTLLEQQWRSAAEEPVSWAQQFRDAIQVHGGSDDAEGEAGERPSVLDYLAHLVALPWKLAFAFVPPASYCGGWACFLSALLMIGAVTAIIGDVASLLGCVLCLPDDVTAITFVALGTSLPDTFASKTAAQQDPFADASVGNVTGSNSVNVFLGLGLPWMIAAIYWATAGDSPDWQARYSLRRGLDFLGPPGSRALGFVVEAGSLSFSVAVFASCALLCLALLQVRRLRLGGELGGPRAAKWASAGFLLLLWLFYVGMSAWHSIAQHGARCPTR